MSRFKNPLQVVSRDHRAIGAGRVSQGRYAIERELGRGGMTTVYLARDLVRGSQDAELEAAMKRALIVGIDDYGWAPLNGCVNDANRVRGVLARNEDGSPNFPCKVLIAPPNTPNAVTRPVLRKALEDLFTQPADVALFYFSGHGTVNNLGGFLVTQDAMQYDEGLPMRAVLALANAAPIKEVVIGLDCCHSGELGKVPELENDSAVLREGVSVLTASRASQVAMETGGSGVFTSLVCDALEGGAADVCGNVTVASVYAYVDQALGAWDQRPLFKSHVSRLLPLRSCKPVISLEILRLLAEYFPQPEYDFPLDPSYEPDAPPKDPEHERVFGHLQKYRAARLLVPVGEEHLYYAAINSKSCRLTPLGRYYWQLASSGKI
jgi:hypothetical protein